VLWSQRSVVSRWVRAEASAADRNKTLVPVMIEQCKRPIMFELTQTAELGHWSGAADDAAWCAFLDDLPQFVGKEPSDVTTPVHAVAQPVGVDNVGRVALALMPFADLTTGKDHGAYIAGLDEEVAAVLSRNSVVA
jgi:hypothetical protein